MSNIRLVENVKKTISELKENNQKFIFIVPNATLVSAEVQEIYRNAYTLHKNGFKVHMLLETKDDEKPFYVDSEMLELPHTSMDKSNLMIDPQDFLIIPEVLTNVMERVKSLPCTKVLFLASIDYALHSLIPGVNFRDFDINSVIVNNKNVETTARSIFGEYNFYEYRVGIPEYFSTKNLKRPVISFVSRNSNDITKVVKSFYLKYPHFRSFMFEDLSNLSRKQFAEKLKKNFAAVWIDRISSFGTFPLECMKSGVIPIGVVPEIYQDYIRDNSGFWCNNTFDLPDQIAKALSLYLEDVPMTELYDTMNEIQSEYTEEASEKSIIDLYKNLVSNKLVLIENYLNNIEKETNEQNEGK